jgi:ATP-dependent Clp protease ATP-binding subunit ClpB
MLQLNIEKQALAKESDPASKERLAQLDRQLAEAGTRRSAMQAQWQNEKSVIEEIRRLKAQLEELNIEETRYEREGNLAKAAEIKHGRMPTLEKELEAKTRSLAAKQETGQLLREEVSEEDIARIVSAWTGIPVTKMLSSEKAKLLELESILAQRVVGQQAAILAVSDAIRRNKAGLSDVGRPMGVFIFLGPTGVGKTELAKTLADYLFNDEKALTRIDMSEYMEKHTVSRLIGAPPGYVGYDEGGQLTETVRRRPYSVILFDEIEKAHPDVFNVLLQLFDEGRLTDGQGRLVDFRNTLIILTSNIGSEMIQAADDVASVRPGIDALMKATFKPEFLNRIDETIVFNRLGKKEIRSIVDIQLRALERRLQEQKVSLVVSDRARARLGELGYDPQFGARPLKRTVQNLVQNPLAKRLIAGEIKQGDTVEVDVGKEGFVFKAARKASAA